MLAALVTSALFLASYVTYHANAGSRPFPGEWRDPRSSTSPSLSPHVLLAATILPLALMTTARGLARQFDRHVRIARWTLPLWLFVSVTGVSSI